MHKTRTNALAYAVAVARSYTPPGNPPPSSTAATRPVVEQTSAQMRHNGTAAVQGVPSSQNPDAELASLANAGKQTAPSAVPVQYATQGQGNPANNAATRHQNVAPQPPQAQPANVFMPSLNGHATNAYGNVSESSTQANASAVALNSNISQIAQTFPGGTGALAEFLQGLQRQNLPPEQVAYFLSLLGFSQELPAVPPPAPPILQSATGVQNGSVQSGSVNGNQAAQAGQPVEQHGRQVVPDHRAQRARSRSPDHTHKRRRVTPPNRRASPTYGVYDPAAVAAGNTVSQPVEHDRRGKGRGRGNRRDHRQRTPPAHSNRPSSPAVMPRGSQPKWVEYDKSLAPGTIKG